MKTLIMTAGLPRSGKSTWAKAQGHPVVNPDSIRIGLHGSQYIALAEPFVWAIAKVMVRALFLAGHDTVILDATNTTRRRIAEWLTPEWKTVVEYFLTSKGVCVERAIATEQMQLLPVIDRMARQWDHPVSLYPEPGSA